MMPHASSNRVSPWRKCFALFLGIFWNRNQHRLRAFWRIAFVGLLVRMLTLLITVVSYAYARLSLAGYLWTITVPRLLLTVGSIWLAGHFIDRRRFREFGFHWSRQWWLDFGFGMALGVIILGTIFLIEWGLGWVTISGVFSPGYGAHSFLGAIWIPVFLFIAVGIYEELLFRGYFLRNLAEGLKWRGIGPRLAIVLAWTLSSIYFGYAHFGNPNATILSSANLAAAGLFLGLGYILTGELAISIGLHITWNLFEGNVFGFPVSGSRFGPTFIAIRQGGPTLWTGGAFGPEAGLLCLIVILFGSGLTLLWVRAHHDSLTLHKRLAEAPIASQNQ